MTESVSRICQALIKRMQGVLARPSLAVALLVTAVFSVRWLNCLPFSGFSPALDNVDTLGFIGRYLIFAQEPFQFPLGLIHGLSFPFESAHISRGAIPLLALMFKATGRLYSPLLEFNYLVLAELLAVFFTAFFTCRLLELLRVRVFWAQLLGACFVALSPALLFRSSSYYGETFVVLNFPSLLLAAYLFIRLFSFPEKWKYRLAFVFVFPVMALIDLYLLFAAVVLVGVALLATSAYSLTEQGRDAGLRVRVIFLTLVTGGVLSLAILWILGNQSNFEVPPRSAIFAGRDDTDWGYGGGFGGGFHVADVFSVLAANPTLIPEAHLHPPKSLIERLDIPILNKRLQPGQYEGFGFIGTIPILLLALATGAWLWRNGRDFGKPRLKRLPLANRLHVGLGDPVNLSLAAIALGCFGLYVLSWGYILHVFGYRFNNILTPSTILAFVYPNFMYARSLGRMAIAFSMLASVLALLVFFRYVAASWLAGQARSCLLPALAAALIGAHLVDVADYLKPPERVVQGNEIADAFSSDDILTLKRTTESKVAIMLVPELLHSVPWNRIGFSIAYHARIPISGATLGFGERRSEIQQYASDMRSILDGEIGQVVSRYGPIVVAAPRDYARLILAKSDVELAIVELKSQDVVLLVPQGKRP